MNPSLVADRRILRDRQQFLQEKFWRYRNGDETYRKSRELIQREFQTPTGRASSQAHELAIQARQVPRVDYQRQSRHARRVLRAQLADDNRFFYAPPERNRRAFANLDWIQREIATEEFHNITDLIEARRDFTFIKVLGAGGNGVVGLWRWTPASNVAQAVGYDVAMKFSILTDSNGDVEWFSVENEKEIMQNLVRAPHLAQLFFLRDKIPDPVGRARRARQARPNLAQSIQTAENLDAAQRVLFMEFARMGDLRSWIQKLAGEDNHLPPEALWRIFDCLVKACKAMEYPPYRRHPGPRDGAPLPEDIPVPQGPPGTLPTAQLGYTGLVHFDLDPKNIFVIGYDQRRARNPLNPDHTQVPRFQVGDFGVAEIGDDLWMQTDPPGITPRRRVARIFAAWEQRNMAKPGWFLPEQFGVEWDQLDRGPDQGPPTPGTWPEWDRWRAPSGPGRYSAFSNIWHIGMNMFCLLLLQHPDFPPVAGRMFSAEPPQYDPVPARHQRWTYGYRLIDNSEEGQEYRDRFTPLLCETIARCLMHKQEHRPDLDQLQRIITNALGDPPPRLADANVQRFFGSDAPPTLPVFVPFVDVNLDWMDPFTPYHGYRYIDESPVDPPGPPDSPPRRRVRRRIMHEDRAYRP